MGSDWPVHAIVTLISGGLGAFIATAIRERSRVRSEIKIADTMRRREFYEEFTRLLEDMFASVRTTKPPELTAKVNKMFALLALYAPDDAYRTVKKAVYDPKGKEIYPKNLRPIVYHAFRKALFGSDTKLKHGDLVDNIDADPILGS